MKIVVIILSLMISSATNAVTKTNDITFEPLLKTYPNVLIVDFYADWCSPCKQLSPILEQLEKEFSSEKILFTKVNIDESPKTEKKYMRSNSIPEIQIWKNGVFKDHIVGPTKEELINLIKKYL